MVDYLRGGAYQSFAGRGAGDVPQLAVLFRDDVDTRHRPQRSSHLLPKFALQRIFPLEAGREVGQAGQLAVLDAYDWSIGIPASMRFASAPGLNARVHSR